MERTVKTHDGGEYTPREFMGKVKDAILAEPKLYDQDAVLYIDETPTCNTPACIAGWMCHFLYGNQQLAYEQAHKDVFGEWRWPWLFDSCFRHGEFREQYNKARSAEDRAEVACRAIDTYMDEVLGPEEVTTK